MPALNFKVFIDKIESGEKCQTIRQQYKRPIKPGDKLYLYTGMRTKNCRKLGEAVCDSVEEIRMYTWNKIVIDRKRGESIILPNDNWTYMSIEEMESLAKADGFNSFDDFSNWFCNQYKFWSYGRDRPISDTKHPARKVNFTIIKWRVFHPAGVV